MAVTHLADTSVLKRLSDPMVLNAVETLVLGGHLGRASITDLEVGYSARTGPEWTQLLGALGDMHRLPTTSEHVDRALEVQRALAAASQRGRSIPDLLVAAGAEAEGLVVLHYDADFDRIAAVTGQPCEWVVPRGTVD